MYQAHLGNCNGYNYTVDLQVSIITDMEGLVVHE